MRPEAITIERETEQTDLRLEAETPVRRLHWGCGGFPAHGWINSDVGDYPGVEIVCDIRDGLPIETDSLDYVVSIHALPEIAYEDLDTTLQELRRVMKPGGVLRLALPDFEKAIHAYVNGDRDYFLIPDEEWERIGSKLVVQMIWYGHSRTLFTFDFVEEMMVKNGFSNVRRCTMGQTQSRHPEIVTLDNREKESMFVEGTK